ncbi:LysR family transcriptional regulator [Pseudomonas citronellolis]|uniref:LysR family transcriptional regulator n=1 Tax=Pseudomonas citronellolis TaxID=53408 RepID=UPI002111EF87|nr:LysR family transcriptional regulator [Pseudomonas citronellolis]UUC49173.1 LysR family transcriptional regulator [Pseudomonas citronellolis]
MDSLNGLRVFLQVAETLSFAQAARLLGLSASAVGKSVARLEERLGVRLFHRSTRSLSLSNEGLLFLERCRRVLDELAAAEQELAQATQQARGRLKISMPLVSGLFPQVLPEFMRCYPRIQLDIDFTDRLVDVIEEGFDLVVRSGELRDSRLKARSLGDFHLLLVAAPAYLRQYGTPRRPADLAGHLCLHYRFPSTGKLQKWPLRLAPGEAEPRLDGGLTCNTADTLISVAGQGMGIACLPDFAVRGALADGSLVQVLAEHTEHQGSFHALWPAGRRMPLKLRVFLDFLGDRLFAAR